MNQLQEKIKSVEDQLKALEESEDSSSDSFT